MTGCTIFVGWGNYDDLTDPYIEVLLKTGPKRVYLVGEPVDALEHRPRVLRLKELFRTRLDRCRPTLHAALKTGVRPGERVLNDLLDLVPERHRRTISRLVAHRKGRS